MVCSKVSKEGVAKDMYGGLYSLRISIHASLEWISG